MGRRLGLQRQNLCGERRALRRQWPGRVFVYPAGSNGNSAPIAIISLTSPNTGESYSPQGIAVDSSGNIYGAGAGYSVFVYSPGSNGNAAPVATISTTMTTGLAWPQGIALDSSGKIYVADPGVGSVFVYPAGSNGNAAPIATFREMSSDLSYPVGIAVDSSGKIYVADQGVSSVFVYSAGSNGNVAPIATISGSSTGLVQPYGIAVDSSGKIYVANEGSYRTLVGTVTVYSAGSNGNVAPIATISGSKTGLAEPQGIAVDSSGKISVAGFDSSEHPSVWVYPALGSSTGMLNEAPIATIAGSNTGLSFPQGIAVDSSGNIYVADFLATGVFVYSAGSNGNVAPVRAIKGPTTELFEPLFIAIQPGTGAPPTAGPTPSMTAMATPTASPTFTAATPTMTPTAVGSPTTLTAAPAKLNFGNVDATGTSKPKKVTLTNKGTTAAVIGSVTATPPFAIAGGADTCSGRSIKPKKKCSFNVQFAPATVANVTGGSINVPYNGSSPAISLSGAGIAVTLKAPSKETFSSVAAGRTGKPKKIKISNPATVSVNLGSTSIGGNDPGAFTITANTCTGALAAKPGNCTITMEFTPGSGATGAQSATAGFSYTYGANNGSVSVPIAGTVK